MISTHDRIESEEGGAREGKEVRCSECGSRMRAIRDQIETEEAIICTSCYQSIVFHQRRPCMEMCD